MLAQLYISFNEARSITLNITCGVPQGSILGPLLFLIYINDLATVSEKVFSILFADDTKIFLSGNNLKEMTETFNVELTKIHKWLEVNKLSINIDKINYMIFRSKKKHKAPKLNIAIDGKILEMGNQTKF